MTIPAIYRRRRRHPIVQQTDVGAPTFENSCRGSVRVPRIEFTRSAMTGVRQTIGRHPPETVGLLGGYLDEPFRVTDFRFCPPARSRDGRLDRSPSHINVDHDYMNFVIDEEWRPNGKYMLGMIHSHPPGYVGLSHGDLLRNEGDMVFLQSCLRHDDSPGRNWRHCLAPIVTFSAGRVMHVHGWIVTLDSHTPIKADIVEVDDPGERNPPLDGHQWIGFQSFLAGPDNPSEAWRHD